MRVSELGEFQLIEVLAQECGVDPGRTASRPRPGVIVDIGDDAILLARRDAAAVWTTDTLVQDVHIPAGAPWQDIGWKALAVNLSDVAAVGGEPKWFLVTLSVPEDFLVEDLVELYRGLGTAARTFDVQLAGGDLVRSPVFSVTVALMGDAYLSGLGEPAALRRDAARIGDVIAVSGRLGDAAGGLLLLQGNGEAAPDAEAQLKRAHLHPVPRIELGRRAMEAGLRCAIDISDGLIQDLGHVAIASDVGLRVDAYRLPLSGALREVFPEQALGLALSGGEDYELALTGARATVRSLISGGADLTEIGEVIESHEPGVLVVDETGQEVSAPAGGWDHFRSS